MAKKLNLGPSKAAMAKMLAAMYAAREALMAKCGSLYAPTISVPRKILKLEQKRFGLSPVQAMAMHVGPGIDDLSMTIWLAATAEEQLELAAAEPAKAVG